MQGPYIPWSTMPFPPPRSVFPLDPPPPSPMQCATLLAPSPQKLFSPPSPMGGSPSYLSIDASLLTLPYLVWPPLSSSSAVCLPTYPPIHRPTDRKLQTRLRTLFYSLPLLVLPPTPFAKAASHERDSPQLKLSIRVCLLYGTVNTVLFSQNYKRDFVLPIGWVNFRKRGFGTGSGVGGKAGTYNMGTLYLHAWIQRHRER